LCWANRLCTASGSPVMVVGLRRNVGHAVVYTLTVANDHTFFVGAARVLVHNCDVTLEEIASQEIIGTPQNVKVTDRITGLSYELRIANYARSLARYMSHIGFTAKGGVQYDRLTTRDQGFRVLLQQLGGSWRKGYVSGIMNGRAARLHFFVDDQGRVLNVDIEWLRE